MPLLLDGKTVAEALKQKIAAKVETLNDRGIQCGLAILLVGEDAASAIYANRLLKLGQNLGIHTELIKLPASATEAEVFAAIDDLNKNNSFQGILPMMPLPAHISSEQVAARIAPEKDVDAISPVNAGLVASGRSRWAPCTPRAVMAILDYYSIPIIGKKAVIAGRSNVVGKPLFHLLLARDATVTVCHSKTVDLAAEIRQADIVVAAVGTPALVTADMIKPGAIVLDVGINSVDGKIIGDVSFDEVAAVAGAITPVPGGVGAVSTIMVMEAVLKKYIGQAGG